MKTKPRPEASSGCAQCAAANLLVPATWYVEGVASIGGREGLMPYRGSLCDACKACFDDDGAAWGVVRPAAERDLVKGGQGRDCDELLDCACTLTTVFWVGACALGLLGGWALLSWLLGARP